MAGDVHADSTFGTLSFSAIWAEVVAQGAGLVLAEASEEGRVVLVVDSVAAALVVEVLLAAGDFG